MSLRGVVRSLLPEGLMPVARRLSPARVRYGGHPDGWSQAAAMSSGYDGGQILDRVAAATREVVAGRAAYERDSMLFREAEYCHPVLGALLRSAALNGGHLEVVDFGGALGSLYWQYRGMLAGLQSLRWQVVEQPAFVALGRREFAGPQLGFAESLEAIAVPRVPPLLLAGSVLQYMEEPERTLEQWLRFPAQLLVLDRMPMTRLAAHRLYVQRVPRYLYDASYPCWMLSESRLREALRGLKLLYDYDALAGEFMTEDWQRFRYRGFVCERVMP